MAQYFPATHSTLSVKALRSDVLSVYALPKIVDLTFLNIGLNDTYVAKAIDGQHYILRVYRANWRSHSEICYELDALNHLANQGIGVARPIRRMDGEWMQALSAIEGDRYAVLFDYAPGKPISYFDKAIEFFKNWEREYL